MIKKKNVLFIIALTLVIVFGLFFYFSKDLKTIENRIESEKKTVEKTHSQPQKAKKPIPKQESEIDMDKPEDMSPELWERYLAHHKRSVEHNGTIEFYGKVIDQHGEHIPDVKVEITISQRNESLASLMSGGRKIIKNNKEFFTDWDGRFSITNEYGDSLTVTSLEKDGYVENDWKSFAFGTGRYATTAHKPDPDNPVIFQMWKELAETEPLIKKEKGHTTIFDGGEIYINLITGEEADVPSNGDVMVSAFMEENAKLRPYDWSATVKVPDGGLIETEDKYLYLAPENGYKEEMSYSFNKNDWDEKSKDSKWSSSIEKKFYVKCLNGKVYAAIIVTIDSCPVPNREGYIHIDRVVNSNGSRNLQYDKKKHIGKPSEWRKIDKKLRGLK